jgi:hypothetical protein
MVRARVCGDEQLGAKVVTGSLEQGWSQRWGSPAADGGTSGAGPRERRQRLRSGNVSLGLGFLMGERRAKEDGKEKQLGL